jgi:hypothetical protein
MDIVTHKIKHVPQDKFRFIKDSRVLLCFPRGLGDVVYLSQMSPHFDPSNEYFCVMFGDDNSSLLEGCPHITPLYMGVNNPFTDFKALTGVAAFGEDRNVLGPQTLTMTRTLRDQIVEHDIDCLSVFDIIWDAPQNMMYPWHSKARFNLVHRFVSNSMQLKYAETDVLSNPLLPTLDMSVKPEVASYIASKLDALVGDKKLCLICRSGFCNGMRDWGSNGRGDYVEGQECRDFMRLMGDGWAFLSLECGDLSGYRTIASDLLNCYSQSKLFNDLPFRYGDFIKGLVARADLCVSIDSGPLHVAHCRPDLPCVGLWYISFPWMYDEPTPNVWNIISKQVWAKHPVDGSLEQMYESYNPMKFQHKIRVAFNDRIEGWEVAEVAKEALACLKK